MSDDLRNRVALLPCPFCGKEMSVSKSGMATHLDQSQDTCIIGTMGIPTDHPASVEKWNTRAALAEMGGVREEYCVKCGAPRSNHPYRHLFEARKFTRPTVEMGEPEPGVRDEGSEMKLAYDAYRKGQRDALDGIRVADPRVILSRVRAIVEGKE